MKPNTSSHTGSRVKTTGWSKERWRLDGALAKAIGVVHDVLVQLSVPDQLEMITKCRLIPFDIAKR